MPMKPMLSLPLAATALAAARRVSSSAANSSRAYQAGRPAAARPASERCRKPRRERFPRSNIAESSRVKNGYGGGEDRQYITPVRRGRTGNAPPPAAARGSVAGYDGGGEECAGEGSRFCCRVGRVFEAHAEGPARAWASKTRPTLPNTRVAGHQIRSSESSQRISSWYVFRSRYSRPMLATSR